MGNIIGFVGFAVTHAWTQLCGTLGHTTLSAVVAPYIWYSSTTGMFEHVTKNDGFYPTTHLQSLLVAGSPALTGPGYDAPAMARIDALDHAYRHVSYALLKKLKDILCNNQLYTLNEQQVTKLPLLLALHRQHESALPFSFS